MRPNLRTKRSKSAKARSLLVYDSTDAKVVSLCFFLIAFSACSLIRNDLVIVRSDLLCFKGGIALVVRAICIPKIETTSNYADGITRAHAINFSLKVTEKLIFGVPLIFLLSSRH